MGRVAKRTQHLRGLASKKARLHPPVKSVDQVHEENVVYVRVQEGQLLNPVPEELSRDLEEWRDLFDEPESDGPVDSETDDEDWRALTQTLHQNEDWIDLKTRMQLASATVKKRKPHNGISRSNVYRRDQVRKEAAKGTAALTLFGFTSSKEPKPVVEIQGYNQPCVHSCVLISVYYSWLTTSQYLWCVY